MKKILALITIVALTGMVNAWTYTEGFDVDGDWTGGSMGSYNPKAYTNDAAPADITFIAGPTVREPTEVQAGNYAWRVDDIADISWRMVLPEGAEDTLISSVFYTADWDVSDNNTFAIRYSTDSGATWTTLLTDDASYYTDSGLGDKEYKMFQTGALNISPDAGEAIYLEVLNVGGDERILVDSFYAEGIPEPALLGLVPLALLAFRRK